MPQAEGGSPANTPTGYLAIKFPISKKDAP